MDEGQKQNKLEGVEEYGLFLERNGYPPAAARVYALLLVWEPDELHFGEIQALLQLSKGATSGALNFLQGIQRVRVLTKPGIRKRFYAVDMVPGAESAERLQTFIQATVDHLGAIIALRAAGSPLTRKLIEKPTVFGFLLGRNWLLFTSVGKGQQNNLE